ncbi:hypothetical protein H5410_048628 [Solanum commersonii]|uniref:C2H2-type domain-containing protein n=1 Tax=Solanum commersonii TaxID=4109 RepID=A0A9J5XKD1_SOLCO|nr:hypothetical protein H5410_048628 [Solanum commersonii]
MNNPIFSPPSFHVLLRCPLCDGAFRTHMEFRIHVLITHPSRHEQDIILRSHVYASIILSTENPPSAQPAAPQHGTFFQGNLPSTQPANPAHARNNVMPISRGRAPPVNMLQMERRNRVGDSNSSLRNSNQTIVYGTRQLINQLDVPVSSNVGELVNMAEEQNDLDLNLRL